MSRLAKLFALVAALLALPVAASAAAPRWHSLPPPPLALQGGGGVWTGRELILFGRRAITALDSRGNPYTVKSVDAAEAYHPRSNSWTRLAPPAGPDYVPGYRVVWTGRQLLAFGAFHSVAYTPRTNTWRELRKPIPGGFVVWTGREAIGWGGGCCGDATADGAAYNAATNTYRKLAPSPLGPSQGALGAWTGHEVVLFVSGYSPDGKPYPARYARGAAYNPATNTWRRLPPLPNGTLQFAGAAAWDGRELLLVGAGPQARSSYAFDPATNRWRRLASLPATRIGPGAVWTGTRLLVYGGQTAKGTRYLRDGAAYDPRTDRWTAIPAGPIANPAGAVVAWTGGSLIVAAAHEAAGCSP